MLQEVISSKDAPKAIGPYSPAIKIGDFIFTSGQLPLVPETNELISDDIQEQTRQCLDNLQAVLKETSIDLNYVLKTTVYITDMNDFAKMNEVYAEYFNDPYPARSACEVSKLAKGAKVEIEAIAIDTRALEVICSKKGVCEENACTTVEE